MNKIVVLLSTYNGERFLDEQLASIYKQEEVDVNVIVRDDGSTDRTCEILENWHRSHKLEYYKGDNIGPAKSFFELLHKTPCSNYYAFADQDDVWYSNKLCRAVDVIKEKEIPFLYFSNVDLMDSQGTIVQPSLPNSLAITKHNSFIESFASGCTMVFNDKLRNIVCQHIPKERIYHDRWVFLTAIFFGKVYYDGIPSMGYRQHGNNQVGTKTEKEKGCAIIRLLSKGDFSVSRTAELFSKYYLSELKELDKYIVYTCINYNNIRCKLRLLFKSEYRLALPGFRRNVYWKLRILFNRI